MSDDVKTLIAESLHAAEYAENMGWLVQSRAIRELAVALEASVQAPDEGRHEMSDEKITALIAEARIATGGPASERGDVVPARSYLDLVTRLADALEASVQAPAVVDREALARWHSPEAWREPHYPHTFREDMRNASLSAVDALIASGILLDAAEVEARGLEKLADQWGDANGMASALRFRAQQVREGN